MKTMSLTADRKILTAFDKVIPCSCELLNETSTPKRFQVVYSFNADGSIGVPVMPKIFPSGLWNVYAPRLIDLSKDPNQYKYPFFIPTDAWQWNEVWSIRQEPELVYSEKETDPDFAAGFPTDRKYRMVQDYGYGLHFSKSRTTLGCVKILALADLLWLVDQIRATLHQDGGLKLQVA